MGKRKYQAQELVSQYLGRNDSDENLGTVPEGDDQRKREGTQEGCGG
jgi:hypothetical protein